MGYDSRVPFFVVLMEFVDVDAVLLKFSFVFITGGHLSMSPFLYSTSIDM